VDDVDKSFAHAVEQGGTPLLPPTDMFFGDRYSWVGDPWGHVWALATVKDRLTEDEIDRRAKEFMLAMSKNK
jgi:PhnB protein